MYKILIALLVFFSFKVSSLSVVPFVHSFDPQDRNESTFQYYIENKTDDYLAFELKVFRRSLDKSGNDILTRDKETFDLMPSQIIIPPNKTRNIKVKWKGNDEYIKNPNLEQAFRVVMTQFPVHLKEKVEKSKTKVEIVYEIKTSLYATPKGARSNVKIVSENSKVIVLKNEGTRRAELSNLDFKIGNKKISELLRAEDVGTVIMPNGVRMYNKK